MDLKSGCYYRLAGKSCVVKLLHTEVHSAVYPWDPPMVVYRFNDDEWPHRYECVLRKVFEDIYEGPLDWDEALREFK